MGDLSVTDIAIVLDDYGNGDFQIAKNDLVLDEGLETAVIISLFCDRYVAPEELPDGEIDSNGYWGDIANQNPSDKTGSKLWTLKREKSLPLVAKRAKEYAEEALRWMIEDGVTNEVIVTASIVKTGVLLISVSIVRPKNTVDFRYDYLWQQQIFKRAA